MPVIPVIEIYDALEDENVDKATEETDVSAISAINTLYRVVRKAYRKLCKECGRLSTTAKDWAAHWREKHKRSIKNELKDGEHPRLYFWSMTKPAPKNKMFGNDSNMNITPSIDDSKLVKFIQDQY